MLAATKGHSWSKVSAALWDHHMPGQNNISSSQHFMRQQQRVLQIRAKMPWGELCRLSCTALELFLTLSGWFCEVFCKPYHQPRNTLKILNDWRKKPHTNIWKEEERVNTRKWFSFLFFLVNNWMGKMKQNFHLHRQHWRKEEDFPAWHETTLTHEIPEEIRVLNKGSNLPQILQYAQIRERLPIT